MLKLIDLDEVNEMRMLTKDNSGMSFRNKS